MKLGYWFPAMAIAFGIYFFSDMPRPPKIELGIDMGDKVLHVFAYFLFSISVMFGLNKGISEKAPSWMLVVAAIVASLYGITDEYHQSFVEGRNADIYDWVADNIGAVLGVIFFRAMTTINRKNV